jgi:hypothetical protein
VRTFIVGLGLAPMLAVGVAVAQQAPFNEAGVTMGQWHLVSHDVAANKKIFVAMGGTPPDLSQPPNEKEHHDKEDIGDESAGVSVIGIYRHRSTPQSSVSSRLQALTRDLASGDITSNRLAGCKAVKLSLMRQFSGMLHFLTRAVASISLRSSWAVT